LFYVFFFERIEMSRGPVCQICADSALMKRAAELIAQRLLPDTKIAEQLGFSGHAGRVLVGRHRRLHVEKPAQALAAAANRGRANVEKREETIALAEAGELDDTAAFLAIEEITRDTRKVAKRLGRAAKATEAAGQFTAMTGVVGQQHKNLELRGRLGAHPGFVPQKLTPGEAMPTFSLTINMPDGKTERLTTVVEGPTANLPDTPVVDLPMLDFRVETNDAPVPDVPIEGASAEGRKLGRLFGAKK
jgi:hypothetical protein